MSKVDQKQAVRNVAYCADATWTCALCPYQKANMVNPSAIKNLFPSYWPLSGFIFGNCTHQFENP